MALCWLDDIAVGRTQAQTFLDQASQGPGLHEMSVVASFSLHEGMIMGFANMAGTIDAGRAVIDEVGAALRAVLRARL